MDDERRRRILSDPKIHAAIRAIARLRGVPNTELDDVVHEVIADACTDENVPLDDVDHARRYLRACCRHKAIDRARARIRDRERLVSPDDHAPAVESVTLEDRAVAWGLIDACKRLFPATHEWFERAVLQEESQASIAAEMRVSPGRVRREVSAIRRSLRTFGTVAAATILIAIGMRSWSEEFFGGRDVVTKAKKDAAPVVLRERAGRECAHEEWAACAADLMKASALDPAGDTPPLRQLLETAQRKVHELDATPEP
jgi:DNA-directed RNA polymerase specialized sigma24 family protein